VRPDHYATLGVAPGASAADIRAAYLSQMRQHHPDRNPSPEAGERARAIIAAFKVLSDFDQRSYYDWDRRRDREQAVARAAAPERTLDKKAAIVGAVGAVLVGGSMAGWSFLFPSPRAPTEAVQASRLPFPPAAADPAANPTRAPAVGLEGPVIRMRPALPPNVVAPALSGPVQAAAASAPPQPVPRRPVAAASGRPRPKVVESSVHVAARPDHAVPRQRPPEARLSNEIASLDQFVMSFYGQSWRYGDAPKRAALEETRADFVARRGACSRDSCRRNAYLDLMRDVSSIVETGKPETR
jgi:hypothetical protein